MKDSGLLTVRMWEQILGQYLLMKH